MAVEKITHPKKYDLQETVIEDLVGQHHTEASLAHGWAVRKLMSKLSYVVEPQPGTKNVLVEPIQLITCPEMQEIFADTYRLAAEHLTTKRQKAKSTLQSLARWVYRQQLAGYGKSISKNPRRKRTGLGSGVAALHPFEFVS